jgi:hypothetical protein
VKSERLALPEESEDWVDLAKDQKSIVSTRSLVESDRGCGFNPPMTSTIHGLGTRTF